VQSAGSGQPGIERSVEDIVSLDQKLFHVLESQALQKIFWRDAGPSREEPMKMKRTQPGRGRELVEIGLVDMMSIQKADHVCDSFIIIHTVSLSSLRLHAHPLLAAILEIFSWPANWSTRANNLAELASKRFARFPVVLIAPNRDLEHLRTNLATSLKRRPKAAAR